MKQLDIAPSTRLIPVSPAATLIFNTLYSWQMTQDSIVAQRIITYDESSTVTLALDSPLIYFKAPTTIMSIWSG